MSRDSDRFFVVTGGPGAGKTTLVEALRREGFPVSDEAGRRIIKAQAAISGRALPWLDPPLFAELMLAAEMDAYAALSARPGPVFFDRGVPDVIGYLRLVGAPVPPHLTKAAELHPYNRRVFIAPPWPEIFAQDRERRQTAEEAERTYRAMVATYAELGYELSELPRASVEERLAFVLASTPPPRSGGGR
jgi:predicted ATPase